MGCEWGGKGVEHCAFGFQLLQGGVTQRMEEGRPGHALALRRVCTHSPHTHRHGAAGACIYTATCPRGRRRTLAVIGYTTTSSSTATSIVGLLLQASDKNTIKRRCVINFVAVADELKEIETEREFLQLRERCQKVHTSKALAARAAAPPPLVPALMHFRGFVPFQARARPSACMRACVSVCVRVCACAPVPVCVVKWSKATMSQRLILDRVAPPPPAPHMHAGSVCGAAGLTPARALGAA